MVLQIKLYLMDSEEVLVDLQKFRIQKLVRLRIFPHIGQNEEIFHAN